MSSCLHCGSDFEIPVGRGKNKKYCSFSCKNTAGVIRHRKRLKQKAVDLMGGKCKKCGYDRCIHALEFHHKCDDKEFSFSGSGAIKSWARIVNELKKCTLLCNRCHRELHSGLWYLDDEDC